MWVLLIPLIATAIAQTGLVVVCHRRYPSARIPAASLACLALCYQFVAMLGPGCLAAVLGASSFDPVHSDEQDRYIALGESQRQRRLVVVFADRDDRIRIISARVATRRERKDYEEGH